MSLLTRRYRGFRVINLVGLGLLVSLVLGVYLFKTLAWRERNEIAAVDAQIHQEQLRVRLLQAEVARLEEPRRLEALSGGALGMSPILSKQEITLADLPRLARAKPEPTAPLPPAAPQPGTMAQAAATPDAQPTVVSQ
jgi:hypothetical protein